jgi:hypothetical protein
MSLPRPLKQIGPEVEQHHIVNGKWQHKIRQSDIKRFEHCPEQHRRHLLATESNMQNDSAILGTTFALFPEAVLNGQVPIDALAVADNYLTEQWNAPGLNQVTFDSLAHARALLTEACQVWYDEVLPTIPKGSMPEVKFHAQCYEDEFRIIIIEGTSDLWRPDGSIDDWKYSGRSYVGEQQWKFERYDPQPPHYVMGRGLVEPDSLSNRRFRYVNLNRDDRKKRQNPKVEELPLRLSLEDLQFHMRRVYNMATSIERFVAKGWHEEWMYNPTDWWCSSVWCPSWNDCRGALLGPDPWGNLAKRLKGQ